MRTFITIIISSIIFFGCSSKTLPFRTSVNYVSENKGVLTLRCIGYGNNLSDAIDDAEKNAIMTLLFRGIPGSQKFNRIIIEDENNVMAKNPQIFSYFIDEKMYKTYIMSSIPVGQLQKIKGDENKSMPVDVKINTNSLIKYFEGNGLIRKFGY